MANLMRVVDDFMPRPWLGSFFEALAGRLLWKFQPFANSDVGALLPGDHCQMEHWFIRPGGATGDTSLVMPLVVAAQSRLGPVGKILRAKANLTFNVADSEGGTGVFHEDSKNGVSVLYYPHSHESGTLFNITGAEDRVECKANRAVVFPANTPHAMLLPTGKAPRFVVSLVFLEP